MTLSVAHKVSMSPLSALQPTVGSARADFPFGSPETLFASSQRLLSLPSTTRLFSGHHYPSSDESNVCSATVKDQREMNRHLKEGMGEEDFVRMRKERDGGLDEPKLLHQSLQVRVDCTHSKQSLGLIHSICPG